MKKFIISVSVVSCLVLAACVSTYKASEVQHSFGIGKNASVTAVPDSAIVSAHE